LLGYKATLRAHFVWIKCAWRVKKKNFVCSKLPKLLFCRKTPFGALQIKCWVFLLPTSKKIKPIVYKWLDIFSILRVVFLSIEFSPFVSKLKKYQALQNFTNYHGFICQMKNLLGGRIRFGKRLLKYFTIFSLEWFRQVDNYILEFQPTFGY